LEDIATGMDVTVQGTQEDENGNKQVVEAILDLHLKRDLLRLEMGFKLFLKMYDNWSHGNELFKSSNQLAGRPPVSGL
jgi:hypothetical protein